MEPSTEVNPIPADLDGSSRKNDVEKCKHFSMRNYVSEMRRKDASKGWPFRLDYILSEVSKDILPSLDVPKYRWWNCRYCLPEFWVTATDTENGTVRDASCGKCKLRVPFADAASLGESATLAFNCQLTLNLDMAVAEESNLKVSAEISPKRCNTSLLSIAAWRDDTIQSCSKTIEDVNGNNVEREPADKSATRGSNFEESPVLCCNGNGSLAADNTENASKTVEVDKQAIDRKATKECENEKVGLLDGFVGNGNESGPAELDQCDSPSSDSSEVGPHKSGSLHRKKSRKIRLLTDLLAAVEDTSNNHIRKDNAPLLAMCDASRELRKQTVAEGEMAYCKNAKKVVLKKKRKLASEDFIRSSKHVRRNQEKDNPSILTGTVDNGDADLDSQTEDNERTRKVFSQTSMKSPLPERVDEAMSKKKKKNHVLGHPSETKAINAEIKRAFTSSNVDEFSRGELGKTLSPGQETSKNICFFKENNSLPPMRPDHVPALPPDTSGWSGHPFALTDKNVGENLAASVQYWSAKHSAVNGTHLTSKTSSNVSQGVDKIFISEMRQGPFFHGMEDVSREGSTAKDNTESRPMHVDPSFPSQNVSNAFRSNGVNGKISDGNNGVIPFLNEGQGYAPNMADQRCFWTPNLGILGARKKKKANKHREHSTVVQQCRDKSTDRGNPDDIPMEIVELMAKNQYERCLQEADMDKIPISRDKNGWDLEIVKIAKENSRRGQNLWLDDSSWKREFHPQNGHTVMASKVFGSSAQKSFDISSDVISNNYKMNQMERYHMPSVRHTLFQDQGMPPSNFQSIGGPSKLCNMPNDAMNEDCSRIKALDGNFLSLGVSGHWYPPKHGEELAPRYLSIRPDSIPFVHSIMPQSCDLHSNSINFQPHCPRTPPKVEMNCNRDPRLFTSRPNSLQKPEKDMNFEAHRDANMNNPLISRLNGLEHERRVASLDVSSNETIPAMHLLSLMDAGMHSGKKIRLDENARLPKQPSLPCEYHPKEVCGLHLGLCKTCIPLRRPSFDYDNQAKGPPGKYQELPAIRAFSLSASSSKPANAFRSGSVGKLRVPLDMNDKGKGKCYEVGSPGVAPFLAGNFDLGSSYGFKPYHKMERNFPNSSEANLISPYQRMSELQTIEARNGIRTTIQPPRSSPKAAVCTVNRNPAEFSVPEEGNVYLIGRDDLKLIQRVRNKPELSNTRCRGRKKTAEPKHAAGTSQKQPQIA